MGYRSFPNEVKIMTTPAHSSFDWIRDLSPRLKQLDSIPLTGAAPPFPWEEFSTRLAKVFDREGLSIQPREVAWRTKETLLEGLGDTPYALNFTFPSLRGEVCWVMPVQELDILASLLLTYETHPIDFQDTDLAESFYRFLTLEVLFQLSQLATDKTLVPILTNRTTMPNQDALCRDIALSLQGQTLWGRLILSEEFRHSWIEHFAQQKAPTDLSKQLSALADVIVHVEAGQCEMSIDEWRSVKPGDFVLLDRCSLEEDLQHGRVLLTVNGKKAFRAKYKDGTLKILEFPLLHEVETPMAKQPEDEDEDDLSDLDLPEENHEDEFDEDLFEEDQLSEEGEHELEEATEAETLADEEEQPLHEEGIEEKVTPPETTLYTPEQIPLNVVVELGRIQMSVEQLTKLEPGNLLEIDIHPENGVLLTIQGKAVGKGELIRIGEAIGVRVLQLG